MSQPLNIRGVTTPFKRQLGGNLDLKKRGVSREGYTTVLQKILGTRDLRKIKEHLTTAGLSTDELHTHKLIKERKLISNIKALAKADVLNSAEQAISKYHREQYRENQNLERKEARTFQNLVKPTKKAVMWGDIDIESLSPGAQKALMRTKEREMTARGTKYGIEGFSKLPDQGSLSKKIRLLKEHPHKNPEAWAELERLENLVISIRQQDKRNPNHKLLEKYGVVEIQKDQAKQPLVSGSNKTTVVSGASNNSVNKVSASQAAPIIANSGNMEITDVEPDTEEKTMAPVTKIDRKLTAVPGGLSDKVQPQPAKQTNSGGKQYGFIKSSGDVKLAA